MHDGRAKAKLNDIIWVDADRMSGAACFKGTRVPVDYFEGGSTIDEFLQDFPSVTREQAVQFLEMANEQIIESVSL